MNLDLTPAQNLALQREQCKLEWAAGERRVALRHLDTLLDYKNSDLPDKHELLITKANWLTETNTEFPSEIMGKYLEVRFSIVKLEYHRQSLLILSS